jgi:hypothetical protein
MLVSVVVPREASSARDALLSCKKRLSTVQEQFSKNVCVQFEETAYAHIVLPNWRRCVRVVRVQLSANSTSCSCRGLSPAAWSCRRV